MFSRLNNVLQNKKKKIKFLVFHLAEKGYFNLKLTSGDI